MDLNLRGKLALVTGASKGIGLACARQLAEEGCDLHLASRTKADLERAKETIQARHNVSVTIHPVDLSNGDTARSLAAACSGIDILVNNAGAIPAGDLQAVDEARWRQAWDLKVFGYVNMCRAVYPAMKSRGKGVIVNVLGAWNNFLWPYITNLDPHFHVVSSGLYEMSQTQVSQNQSTMFAAYILSSLPLLVLFVYATKPFMAGVTSGAFKA